MRNAAILCAGTLFTATLAPSYKGHCRSRPVWDYNWDHREAASYCKPGSPPDLMESKQSRARRKLYLIRHGQYNLEGQGDDERSLTPLGREQAAETGRHLAALGVPYTEVVISTLTRAQETGDIIMEELKAGEALVSEHGLSRTDLLMEGSPIEAVPQIRFKPEQYEFEDGVRIEAAFRRFFHRADSEQKSESHELLVCHANVIRYLVCRATQNPPEAWLRMSLAHGSVTEVIIEPTGEVFVSGIGDKGHLPAKMVTFS